MVLTDLIYWAETSVTMVEGNSFSDLLPAHDQGSTPTCFAYAAASRIRAAQKLYSLVLPESHASLVTMLCDTYMGIARGGKSRNTFNVLAKEVVKYGLKPKYVSSNKAKKAIKEKGRPITGRMKLDANQWRKFSKYFRKHPKGTLTKSRIGVATNKTTGHAVNIIGYNPENDSWIVQNSWGEPFANNGHCQIKRKALHDMKYIDCKPTKKSAKLLKKKVAKVAKESKKKAAEAAELLKKKEEKTLNETNLQQATVSPLMRAVSAGAACFSGIKTAQTVLNVIGLGCTDKQKLSTIETVAAVGICAVGGYFIAAPLATITAVSFGIGFGLQCLKRFW